MKTKFGGKKQRESGDVCGLERERGGRFVIKERKKGEPKKERERERKRRRGETPRLVRFKFQQPFPFFGASPMQKAKLKS